MTDSKLHRNHGLFSDYFLNELLPQRTSGWTDDKAIRPAFEQVRKLYEAQKEELPTKSEAQLEDDFIQKVLDVLDHIREVQPTLVGKAVGTKQPDYALFPSKKAKSEARKVKGKPQYFQQALALAEVKKWERSLDKEIKDLEEDKGNPSLQMDRYLYYTEVRWGILTNGRYWRLYNHKTSKELDNYFEVDLKQIIEDGDLEGFKYFYFLFRREAFPEFVDQVYQGSIDYAEELGDNLKENVYEALKVLARGFLRHPDNNLDPETDLKQIHDNCLILLYRIIFLLYAESPRRGERLLPLDDPTYRDSYSFYSLKRRIAEILDQRREVSPIKKTLWSELRTLFSLVNKGSESMGIPENEFFVPSYDGGLFDQEEHSFLENHQIGDQYLARAIDLLSRTPIKGKTVFADYSSLDIRHLGSIYEGLLEFRLGVAPDKLVAVKEKGKQKWIRAEEAGNQRVLEEVEAGDIYLHTDKHERKATGSYYTPDYIVEYIVQNTLGPVIEERRESVGSNDARLVDEILKLKVLDPAMGSGHFLVGAIDFLARKLLETLEGTEIELNGNGVDEEDMRWARREIVERCIFGVDLNPLAVELAKLSLWLTTVSKDKPLSFLDHHLRCGNSLIGARTKDLGSLPQLKKTRKKERAQTTIFDTTLKKNLVKLLDVFKKIEQDPSESLEAVEEKKRKYYEEFRPMAEQFMDVAHVWTSVYFGNEVNLNDFTKLQNALTDPERWQELQDESWFSKAKELAVEKRFFHWELEFPEVWFEGGKRKSNSGFDVVIGNPPYINANELNKVLSEYEKPFWRTRFSSASGAYDIYLLFLEGGTHLVRKRGYTSFITPNKFLAAPYGEAFRTYAAQTVRLLRLLDLSHTRVFEDPSVYPIVTIFKKESTVDDYRIRAEKPLENTHLSSLKTVWRNASDLTKLPENIWGFLISDLLPLIIKAEQCSTQLEECSTVRATSTTSEADEYAHALSDTQGSNSVKFINTGLIDRYSSPWGREPFTHKGSRYLTPYLDLSNPVVSNERVQQYKKAKILCAKMAKHVESYLDDSGTYASANTNMVYDADYDLAYLVAILNSKTMSALYAGYFGALVMSGGYFQFQAPQLRVLPVRKIYFTTGDSKRKMLLNDMQNMYERLDCEGIYSTIEALIPQNEAGQLAAFSEGATGSEEASDVVHDLLAYLARQMVQMHEEQNKEIRGFLTWLEDYIGVPIDNLKNKTKIREYHEYNLDQIFDVLGSNRKGIEQVNIQNRKTREQIKAEFEKSMAKLKPLKEKIEATDNLIDQIVYKLYGLTDEEIKLVEETVRRDE